MAFCFQHSLSENFYIYGMRKITVVTGPRKLTVPVELIEKAVEEVYGKRLKAASKGKPKKAKQTA